MCCRKVIFTLAFLIHHIGYGEGLFVDDYDWDENPEFEQVQVDQANHNAIILKDLKTIEYYFDDNYNTLLQYYTIHTKIQVPKQPLALRVFGGSHLYAWAYPAAG